MSDFEEDGMFWDDAPLPRPASDDPPGWSVTVVFIIVGLLALWFLSA